MGAIARRTSVLISCTSIRATLSLKTEKLKTNTDMSESTPSESYTNLVNLQAVHSEAHARMAELEATLHQQWLDLVDAHRKDYARLQEAIAASEEGISYLATVNPQWFEKARTLKTPYGTVSFRRTTKLEVKNEEVSIALLEQLGQDGLPFLIPSKRLNLEALEKLDEAELERVRIKRVTSDSCTVKPAKIDLGKAVRSGEQKGDPQS
jgi:hypothetical protein